MDRDVIKVDIEITAAKKLFQDVRLTLVMRDNLILVVKAIRLLRSYKI